jgi:isobutyryl-CoA mutase
LEGMIEEVIKQCSLPPAPSGGGGEGQQSDYWLASRKWNGKLPLGEKKDIRKIARAITLAENKKEAGKVYDGSSIMINHFNADPLLYGKLKEFALSHRKDATIAEEILWDKLKNKKEGYKFRRQHIIGSFIADFVCLKKGLVIEVDGNYLKKEPGH